MGSDLSAEDISAIADRLASATTGPWQAFVEGRDHLGGDDFIRTGGLDDESPDMYVSLSTHTGSHPAGPDDLDFIAHARQDIGRLLVAFKEGSTASEHGPDSSETSRRLELSAGEYLVLFECFHRMCETERIAISHPAEAVVIDKIAGQLERQLVEPFDPSYPEMLEAARNEAMQAHRERFGDESWVERLPLDQT